MTEKIKILYVTDETNCSLIKQQLAKEGFNHEMDCTATETGYINALNKEAYDIVFADDSLPALDGMKALKILKNSYPDLPFLLICDESGEAIAIQILQYGATDYILKQKPARLVPLLKRIIREKKERAEIVSAQSALQESENQLKYFMNNMDAGIGIFSRDGRIEFANPALGELFGADYQSLPGNNCWEYFDNDTQKLLLSKIESIFTDPRKIRTEIEVRRSDGEYRFVQFTAWPRLVKKENVHSIFGIFRDKTEEKNARIARVKLAAAVEHAGESIIITDRKGTIEYLNPAFAKFTGYSVEETLGKTIDLLCDDFHDNDFYKMLWQKILSGKSWRGTITRKRKNGEEYIENTAIFPVTDRDGKVQNIALINREITEFKNLEEQLLQAQKMEAVGHLASGIAHDFNNLLTVIKGYSELIIDGLSKDDEHYSEVNQIYKAGERASELTNQLLDFSRNQIIQPKALNLNRFLEEKQKIIAPLIGENIELVLELHGNLARVKVDPGQLDQAVLNIILNARDAMPDGGVLTINTQIMGLTPDAEQPVQLMNLPEQEFVRLSIADSGVGMTEEIRSKVFEPFFTTKDKSQGTALGLGLSVVYGIVKQNNGYIFVHSAKNAGSRFDIFFPTVPDIKKTESSAAAAGKRAGDAIRILLVEDDKGVRRLSQKVLRKSGFDVVAAENGFVALQELSSAEVQFDVVVTDVIMPKMSGRELVAEIEKMDIQPRILYISGYSDDVIARQGILENETSYLQKPFSPEALVNKIKQMLADTSE